MGREGAVLKLSFDTAKMEAYANKVYVCLFVIKNMRLVLIGIKGANSAVRHIGICNR